MENRPDIGNALLKALPDLIFLFDKDGRFHDYHANDPKELLMPPEAFLGKTLRQVMPPDQSEAMHDLVSKTLRESGVQHLQYRLVIGGQPMDFEVRFTKLGEDRVLGIVRNITDLTSKEAELGRKTEELEKIVHSMVGREKDMIKLKERVAELEERLAKGS